MIKFTPDLNFQDNNSVSLWRKRYEEMGFKTIPLVGKKPFGSLSWKLIDSFSLWNKAGDGFAGNIGIVTGNGLAVVDADDHATASYVASGLQSMGISPAIVKTPRGMHFYLKIDGVPSDYKSAYLAPEVGFGEFRAQDSYVVAPRSKFNGFDYVWINGRPEDIANQPVVQWRDLLWLLSEQYDFQMIDALPIRLLNREMPARANSLLDELRVASKGQSIDRYHSRSEAEAAVICMLILAGWPDGEILLTFQERVPGKFAESKGTDQIKYFERTYRRALSKIVSHPTRIKISRSWQFISSNPYWHGRNGYTKRDTLLGLLAICWQFGCWEVYASERDLAQYVAASPVCIGNTLRALSEDGYIEKLHIVRDRIEANYWKVLPLDSVPSQIMICDNHPREEEKNIHELWSATALGRSAGTIYKLLTSDPVSVGDLARQTGKAWSTVKAALDRLQSSGLSKREEGGWILGNQEVSHAAIEFDTDNCARRRRERHNRDQELFLERMVKQTKNQPLKPTLY